VREEGGWIVRSISGSAATNSYRCPGCDQEIPPGTPHVVAWPAGDIELSTPMGERSSTRGVSAPEGTVERRHWHTRCWQRRR
jgi:hypothetical protein